MLEGVNYFLYKVLESLRFYNYSLILLGSINTKLDEHEHGFFFLF